MIEAVIAGVFGLLIGSFLNVCIYRWPRDLSVVKPRSHCPQCEKTIAWYDNVPLVSYAVLGGKCRHCGARIPLRYPIVEALTALLFFFFVWREGLSLAALRDVVFCAMIVGLVFADLEERILPDEFTIGGAVVGIVFSFFVAVPDQFMKIVFALLLGHELPQWSQSPVESVIGAAFPTGLLWFAGWAYEKVRHREGLGFGDVKLMAMVGAFLGLTGALTTLVIGSTAGAVCGYGYILVTKQDAATYELPFGTFLGFAAIAARMLSS